jgi:hypothetical protein
MTWLGLVGAVTMIIGFAAVVVLGFLGISLRSQGAATTRQLWNRRMLMVGGGGLGVAFLLPFVFVGPPAGLVFAAGWIALGVLVACMFSARLPTRLLSILLFLTVALATVLRLPPHRAALYGVGVFVAAGLLLAKFGRILIRNAEAGAEFREA